ncbi:MAG: transporter [Thalassobius sp.]|nr:transporter [Thalassovita sp.]
MSANGVYYRWLLPILFVFAAVPIHAQVVSLESALDEAQANYPEIKAKQALVKSAEDEKKAVANAYIPTLSMQHQYTYATSNNVEGSFYPNGVTISPSGGVRTENINDPAFGVFTSAMVEWNVYGFGKLNAQNNAAKAGIITQEAELDNSIFQHKVKTADAYLMLLIAEKLTEIQEKNVQRAASFYEAVSAGVSSGLRSGVDSSLASAEYAKAKILYLESERNENARKYQLMELLGRNAEEEMINIDSMEFFSKLPMAFKSEEYTINQHPVLTLQQAKMSQAHQQGVSANREFYPDITLVGAAWARGSGVSNSDNSYHTDFASGTEYQVQNYLLGVAIKWVPTNFFASRNRQQKYEHIVEQQTETYNQQQLGLKRQLRESEMQYKVMVEQAETAPIQLHAAQKAYKQAAARYKNGLTDLPTMLQSVVALNRAEADYAIAYSNVWRSYLMIAASKGDLSDFIEML